VILPPQTDAKSVEDTFTFQLIWVTGNRSCYQSDHQFMAEYQDLTQTYLSAYGLDHFYFPAQCITLAEFEDFQPPQYTDLLIVVYEKTTGRVILHDNFRGGYFQPYDTLHSSGLKIETCQCPSFNYNDPIWVLSHELSHFALYYLGFTPTIWVDWVHNIQNRYYQYCPDGDTTDNRCNGLYTKIHGISRVYKTMSIYPTADQGTPFQSKFSYVDSSSLQENSEGINPGKMADLSIPTWIQNNVKMWSEGSLTNEYFVLAIKYFIEQKIIIADTFENDSNSIIEIPEWIKISSGWWVNGLITDQDFLLGIQYLLEEKIILA